MLLLAQASITDPSTWGPAIVNAVICFAISVFGPVFIVVMEFLPDDWAPAVGEAAAYLSMANAYIPIDLGVSLALIYVSFLTVMIPIKLVWKLFFPGLG